MKFYEVKEKIERVMNSCETIPQEKTGFTYCLRLINKYLFSFENQDLKDSLCSKIRRETKISLFFNF